MKFAIIQTGGKQYRVEEGTTLKVEKLDIAKGKPVVFDKVLLTYNETSGATIGTPYVEGVKVHGTVLEQDKNSKIIVFKYKAKKRYRKKTGHRQPFTLVKITNLGEKREGKPQAKAKKALTSLQAGKKPFPKKKTLRRASKTRA